MLCQLCQKNEATVEFTEIINDEVTQFHLCDECAKNKGVEMEQHFNISDLLAGMSDLGLEPEAKEIDIKCPKCGMVFNDFRKIGRLGCGECYNAFRRQLVPLLKRIHGSTRHVGGSPVRPESPGGAQSGSGLQELRQKLRRAIETEEFEEAARIRDEIRESEKKAKKK